MPHGLMLPDCAMEGEACREIVHDFNRATFNPRSSMQLGHSSKFPCNNLFGKGA